MLSTTTTTRQKQNRIYTHTNTFIHYKSFIHSKSEGEREQKKDTLKSLFSRWRVQMVVLTVLAHSLTHSRLCPCSLRFSSHILSHPWVCVLLSGITHCTHREYVAAAAAVAFSVFKQFIQSISSSDIVQMKRVLSV